MDKGRLATITVLGSTQTLAWASSYYLPAILADDIARDTGTSTTWLYASFSVSLIISALLGPRAGRLIDRGSGNAGLAVSNHLFAGGLVLLYVAQSLLVLQLAWIALGIGIGIGLYDAAFAVLGRIYGTSARGTITGITLFAGFASTIGWPLTAWGASTIGWRDTCLAWAALHFFVALPLNYWCLPRPTVAMREKQTADKPVPLDRPMILLGFAFAAAWVVTAGMAAHFPRIMEAAGASTTQAIAAGALIGPAQVGARLLEAGPLKRLHPLITARLAALTHPIGVAVLLIAGGSVASSAFAVLHGSGNGILTIARGTVPLAIFGPENYGYRLGLIGLPSRFLSALAPFAFSVLLDGIGASILFVTAGLSLAACAAFCILQAPQHARAHAD